MAGLTFLLTLITFGVVGIILWLSISYDPDKEKKLASNYLRKATIQISDNMYHLARQNLDIAIDLESGHYEAHYQRAVLNLKENNFIAAIQDFTSVLKIDPMFEKAYDSRGIVFFMIGEYQLAVRDFEELMKHTPVFEDKTYSYYGLSLYHLHRYEEALEQFNNFLRIPGNQQNEDILLHRANCFFFKGEYERAHSETEKILKINSENNFCFNLRGLILHKQGETRESLLEFKKSLEIDKTFPNVYHNIALVLIDQKMYLKAIKYFTQAIHHFHESDPNLILSYKKRASVFEKIGNYTMAINDYTRILELTESQDINLRVPYFYRRSDAFLKNGESELAFLDLTFVIESIPEHDGARVRRGEYFVVMEKIDEAIVDFKKALELNPEFAYSYFRLSTIYEMEMFKGKDEEKLVVEYAQKASKLRPDDELYSKRVNQLIVGKSSETDEL